MDDAVSRDSVTSSTSEEFVVVNGEPKLKVAADVSDISKEIASATATESKMYDSSDNNDEQCDHVIPSSQSVNVLNSESILENYPDTPNEEDRSGSGAGKVWHSNYLSFKCMEILKPVLSFWSTHKQHKLFTLSVSFGLLAVARGLNRLPS